MGNAIGEEDYRGRKVICTDRTWNEHIVSGHEIMKKNKEAVIDTIQNPDSVYVSSTNPSRDVYFKQSNKSTYSLFTKVIVENKLEIGEIVTAFPTKGQKGGIGNVIYIKPKNSI